MNLHGRPILKQAGLVLALAICQPVLTWASDFATAVVAYVPGNGLPADVLTGLIFDDPNSALGPPTVDTTGDGFIAAPDAVLPILPVHPAFRQSELVSIGAGGHLTLAFDHPVLDEPENPYGLDLIVFGNASLNVIEPASWTPADPLQFILGSTLFEEPGEITVSADGTNWFSVDPELMADAFAPTLGRTYDTNQPAVLPGISNLWWGAATDPTFPLDPAIGRESFLGTTLAYTARAYGRSAGGTGIDLGPVPLPTDPGTGHKYIHYVRITHPGGTATPEIDAVADVRPVTPRELWVLDQFPWQQRAEPDVSGWYDDPDEDQRINLWEYALGSNPDRSEDPPAIVTSMTRTNGQAWLLATYRWNPDATDTHVYVQSSNDLDIWTSNSVIQSWSSVAPSQDEREITAAVSGTNGTTFLRLVMEEL